MIKLENLSKYYKSESNITLGLSKVNLEFNNKEFVAITGESGSGKSTLLNVISGIDSYEEGELYFNGEETSHYDITDWENYRRDNISFVFQNYGLIDSYTVYENVVTAMIINNLTEEEAKEKAIDIIKKVGLYNHIKHKGTKLSGGQKQRLAIARALAKDCKVLVADEPTGNLDSETSKEIIALLKDISQTKLVIMVTHDFEEVKDVVTRKIRVFDGKIAEDVIYKEVEKDDKVEVKSPSSSTTFKKSLFFSKLNIKSQPKRTTFTFIVTFIMSLLIGLVLSVTVYYGNTDTYTDVYNPYFSNLNKNRVVVKKEDNTKLTDDDYEYFNNNDYISSIFKYDIMLDLEVSLQDKSNYYLPSFKLDSIHQLDGELELGRLPNKVNEVVISLPKHYIEKDMLDKPFTNSIYYKYMEAIDIEIVGITESKTYERTMYVNEELLAEAEFFAYIFNYDSLTVKSNDNSNVLMTDSLTKPFDYQEVSNSVYLSSSLESAYQNSVFLETSSNTYEDINVVYSDSLSEYEMYVSKDLRDLIYSNQQITIYLEDYNNLAKLEKELNDLGYLTISPYFVSLDEQNMELVMLKISMTILSIIIIIVIYILGYIVLKLVFNEKAKDFAILKSIGLDKESILSINVVEITFYFIISFIFTFIVIEVLSLFLDFFVYFKMYHHGLLLIINILLGVFISLRFNSYINKRTVIQTIKEK